MKKNLSYFISTTLVLTLMLSLISFMYKPSYAISDKTTYISNSSIDKKIGMNGHVDVPRDILYAGSVVREYHNFGWTITENKQMYFDRFSYWDFDGYYKDLYEHGITILPCIQMGEQKVFNRNRNEKPVMKGDDTTLPMSYKIHANYLYNYAARYGKTVVSKDKLNLDPNASYKSGLGYITYYEDWNEPDKTWQGPDAQFNSTELAAMLSADYDGHEGTLGDTYGVKQADKNSKLVMGGIAGGSTMVTWLTEMQNWANTNRTDKKLPMDVINYHQYTGTHSPENSTFVSDAKKIMEWRDANDPSLEIWITEFGWDTNLGSVKHAAPTEDAQRDWIIREYLIGDRIGLDKMTVYDALNDGPSSSTTQYSTSGLATKVSEGTVKKSSWYGVNTLKNTMKGYRLTNVIKEDETIYIYQYSNGKDICYVLWSPTENNVVINNYELNIGKYQDATLTILKDKEDLGVTSDLTVNNNSVTLTVTESPIFVKVSNPIVEETDNETKNNTEDNKIVDDKKEGTETIVEDKTNTKKEVTNTKVNEVNNNIKESKKANISNETKANNTIIISGAGETNPKSKALLNNKEIVISNTANKRKTENHVIISGAGETNPKSKALLESEKNNNESNNTVTENNNNEVTSEENEENNEPLVENINPQEKSTNTKETTKKETKTKENKDNKGTLYTALIILMIGLAIIIIILFPKARRN